MLAAAGFKGVEIDNIDLTNKDLENKNVGITPQNWKNFITDLAQYAKQQGLVPIQKNTPTNYTTQDTKNFGGMTLEMTADGGDYSNKFNSATTGMDWNQVKAFANRGEPVMVTSYGDGVCNNVKSYMNSQGINTNNVFVTCQQYKAAF